jgi:hypothetical protein
LIPPEPDRAHMTLSRLYQQAAVGAPQYRHDCSEEAA